MLYGRLAHRMGRRPPRCSRTRAGSSCCITSPRIRVKLGKSAMVSSSTGYSRRSSSTDTTFPARWASSRVRGPMPGPISSTPVCSSAPQAAAMSRGTQPWMRKFWPMALEK